MENNHKVIKMQHNHQYSIDDILGGKRFRSNAKDSKGNYIGIAVALQQALDYVNPDGIVATMPELIAAKIKADSSHHFWQSWYCLHTEENIGIDKKGNFYNRNEPVLVIVNGGGILTPNRIRQAYNEGLINNSAGYRNAEFDGLLEERLPNEDSIHLYRFEEIKNGVSNLPHRFGVVMPYKMAQETKSGYHNKKPFMDNPLVIARVAVMEHLEPYYERAKDPDKDIANYHPFKGRQPYPPQGRLLFLNDYNYLDMHGYCGLHFYGYFVGVAPGQAGRACQKSSPTCRG